MNRSPEAFAYAMSRNMLTFFGSVQGAGAAAPVIPTTTLSPTSSIQPMKAEDNFVSPVAGDITRSGVGVYTIKLKDGIPYVLDIGCPVWGTDGKYAQITDYNPTTRVISVKTFSAGGAAADLAATDNLKLAIVGRMDT